MRFATSKKLLIRSFECIVLLVLILMAVYVSIGRILITTVGNYRENLESFLGIQLKVPVTIDKISGDWTYLDPKFTIEGLRIGLLDSASIKLNTLVLGLDTLATLQEGSVVICEVEVSGLRLVVQRNKNGDWLIKGLPPSKRKFETKIILDLFANLNKVMVNDTKIDVVTQAANYRIESVDTGEFQLSIENDIRTLSWTLALIDLDEKENFVTDFQIIGQYQGDIRSDSFESELYMQVPSLNLVNILPPIKVKGYRLSELKVKGQFWLTSNDNGLELRGLPVIESALITDTNTKVFSIGNLNTELLISGSIASGGVININNTHGQVGEQTWVIEDFTAVIEVAGERVDIAADFGNISIERLSDVVLRLGQESQLLSNANASMLEILRLQGELNNTQLSARLFSEKPDVKIVADLENAAIALYGDGLAVSHLDGFLALGFEQGYLDISNDAAFEVYYARLFPKPWLFNNAHGRLSYKYESTAKEFTLSSGLITVERDDLMAFGRVRVNLPAEKLAHTWALELGVLNADLLDSYRYIPKSLSPEVQSWLKKSIVGGTSRSSGMVFHGSLNGIAKKDQKAFEIYFKVDDTVLDYDDRWPRFDDLSATIYVGNTEIFSDDAVANLYDSRIVSSEIRVPLPKNGLADTVLVTGELVGPAADGIRLLTETPLFELTNKVAQKWTAEGDMSGKLTLNIPLGKRAVEPAYADLRASLGNVSLSMPEYDLQIDNLTGDFNYESKAGISSPAFTGALFDKPFNGKVNTLGNSKGGVINLNIVGDVAMADLFKWSKQPLLTRGYGLLPYDLEFSIPFGDKQSESLVLSAHSSLEGVFLDMPMPMGKVATEHKRIDYQQIFLNSGYRVNLQLGTDVSASIQIMDDFLTGGQVRFGTAVDEPINFDKLNVVGSIDRVKYEVWDQLILDLQTYSDVSIENELVETLDAIDVSANVLDTYGFQIDNVNTHITRVGNAWRVGLQSEMLQGDVIVADAEDAPIEMDLDFLRLESSGKDVDPLSDIDPKEMINIRVDLDKLLIDQEDYGSWKFAYTPLPSGGEITELEVKVKGFSLQGDGAVTWQFKDGLHTSGFTGKVLVPDVAKSLAAWGYAESIKGENFSFLANVSWPGTPAMVDLNITNGTIELEKGKGRFVQAEASVGPLKLLGILDFASIAKRFRFDFSDVVDSGYSFNKIKGTAGFSHGTVEVVKPLVIEGSSSIFKIAGNMKLESEVIDGDMIVTLPVNRNLPWYAAYSAFAIGPLTAAGVFFAQKIFVKQIDAISSAKYKISGTLDEPEIEFVSIFNAKVRESGSLEEQAEGSIEEQAEGSIEEQAEGSKEEQAEGS